ncbi:MAG: PAS domain S-box protein [Methanobacterium sp.]
MTKNSKGIQLRDKAEEILREHKSDMPLFSSFSELVQELQTHQIELEMQNKELRSSQEELEEAKLKYFNLYEFAPVAYFSLDENEIIKDVNLAGSLLLGIEKTKLINSAFIHYINFESRRTFYKHLEKVKSTGSWQTCLLELIYKDGIIIYAHIETILIQNDGKDSKEFRITATNITKLKKDEQSFEIFHSNPAAMTLTDKEGRWIDVNESFIKLTGYNKEELIGHTSVELNILDSKKRRENLIHVQEKGSLQDVEFKLQTKSGENRFIILNSEFIELDDEIRIVSFLYDITERKKIEEDLKRSAALLDVSNEAIFSWDYDNGIVSWNQGAEKLYGYSSKEAIGSISHDLLKTQHPFELKEFLEKLAEYKIWSGEIIQYTKDGREIIVESRFQLIQDTLGRRIVIECNRDITKRKKSDEELLRLNRALQALSHSDRALTHAKDETEYLEEVCKFIIEDCGYLLVWIGFVENDENKTVRPVAYSGFEEGYIETLGITWADRERGRGPTGTAVRTGEICACRNILTDHKFEPWREEAIKRGYASVVALPLINDSNIFGVLTIYSSEPVPFSEDEINLLADLADDVSYGITTLRLSDEKFKADEILEKTMIELKRSNKELEQFAYVASHDLQEPLRMVSSFTQLLEKQYKDELDETAVEYINFAVDGAKRMQLLINDLLAYSRVTRKSNEFEMVNLEKVLDEVLFNLEIVIDENQAIITRKSLPEIQSDYGQMVQLFQNLIGNALKYRSEETPEIHISALKEDDNWLFSVEDNGIGIESEYFEQIFQIFRRLHTHDEHKGTGIGLAITKRIVEHHSGRIWVESELGKCSTFYFTIPIK